MQTLAELQQRMNGDDAVDALAAANELTNYFLIYNDEFNLLVQKKTEADLAILAASTDPAGADHALILHWQSLSLGIESRMRLQDAKMIAFQASTLAIDPPTAAQVTAVKQLTTQVAAMVLRDTAVKDFMLALGQVGALVNQIQGV